MDDEIESFFVILFMAINFGFMALCMLLMMTCPVIIFIKSILDFSRFSLIEDVDLR